jgi:hypothetical protein
VGVVTAPSLSDELTPDLVDTLRRELTARLPDATWQIELVHDGPVEPPAGDSEIVGAAREALLTRGWDLMVLLTDLPLRWPGGRSWRPPYTYRASGATERAAA